MITSCLSLIKPDLLLYTSSLTDGKHFTLSLIKSCITYMYIRNSQQYMERVMQGVAYFLGRQEVPCYFGEVDVDRNPLLVKTFNITKAPVLFMIA